MESHESGPELHAGPGASGSGFRAGFVALAGLPNVGKSSLLNRLVGERLSIVTPKAQTTRRRLAGIFSDASHQAVFLDTPGRLDPRYLLQESMRREADAAVEEADVVVYVADAGFPPSLEDARGFRPPREAACLLCLNKVDRVEPDVAARQAVELEEAGWNPVLPTVATTGEGVAELREAVLSRLPDSPPLYPTDELATEPVRFFVAELVRETCFEELAEEVPYAVAVRTDEFEERDDEGPVYIACTLFVERPSQKGIVIGAGGRMIREIGTGARRKVEEFLGRDVYLDLRVKVLPNWRKRHNHLTMLGFRAPRGRS